MLKLDNLSYKNIFRSLSCTFEKGTLTALTGRNGAGKTTLLKVIKGLWKPTSGSLTYNNENLLSKSHLELSRLIAFVPQNPHVTFPFTIEQFVAMGRYPHGDQKIDLALEVTGITSMGKKSLLTCSGGEKQLAYIARALATEAPILLLDEPTTSLDQENQKMIWTLLNTLTSQEKILITATHDAHAIAQAENVLEIN